MTLNPGSSRLEVYAQAVHDIVAAEGFVTEATDELFRFARTFEGNDDLRMALSDPTLPVSRRLSVVEDLMGRKALPVSTAVVSFLVSAGRAHDLVTVIDRFVALAAEARSHEVAEVRSALALDEVQQSRLAEALSRSTGKQVEVKVVVDQKVLGGLVTRIGDTVIDGTVRHRLEQMKEQM